MTPKEFEEIKEIKSHLIRYIDGKKIYQPDGKMEIEKKHRGQFSIAEERIIKSGLKKYFKEWRQELETIREKYGHTESFKTKENQLKQIEDTILIKVEQNTYK